MTRVITLQLNENEATTVAALFNLGSAVLQVKMASNPEQSKRLSEQSAQLLHSALKRACSAILLANHEDVLRLDSKMEVLFNWVKESHKLEVERLIQETRDEGDEGLANFMQWLADNSNLSR